MDKAPDAFRTISEVADDLDIPQHVLRFWETRVSQIKPMKRSGGRRYYRPDDVDLLRGIRRLLYGEGYTIRGVQRILKEQGIKAVQAMTDGPSSAIPSAASFAAIDDSAQRGHSAPDEDEPDADATDDEDAAAEAPATVRRAPEPASPVMLRGDPPVPPQVALSVAAKADEGGAARKLDIARLKTALDELIACRKLLDHALNEA